MSKKVTVYSTATCAYCHMLKKYLTDNKIDFIEKHVDKDFKSAQEMVAKSGQMGVPFTVVSDDKGQEQSVLGFDVVRLNSILTHAT